MKLKNCAILALCGLGAAATPALAEPQPGFYLGVSAGKSTFDFEKDELDDVALDAFFSQGVPVLSASSTFEDSDNTLAFIVGYRFLPYVAIEASYLDLGAAEYRASGTVNPPGPRTTAPASLLMDIETTGFTLAGIGNLPIGNVVDVHARLGLLFAQTELSVAATIDQSTGREQESLDAINAFLGLGMGFQLGQHWSLSLDWARHFNVGDENDDDDIETTEGFDIDALSATVSFTF